MIPLRNITIDQALSEAIEHYPTNTAILTGSQRWTYLELDQKINHYARGLLGSNIAKGTHVAIDCDLSAEIIFQIFSLCRIGAVPVLVNPHFTEKEKEKLLSTTDTKLWYPETFSGYVNKTTLEDKRALVVPEDDAFLLFTSGTSDFPKAVLDSQYSRANMGLQQAEDQRMTSEDKVCIAMPIFHCFSLSVNIMAGLFSGACICIPKSHHTADLVEMIEGENCTILNSVPALFHALSDKGYAKESFQSVRFGMIGGSFCPESLFCEMEDRLGFPLISSLGQTEACAGITVANLDDSIEVRAKTVGHIMNHISVKFAEDGEIMIHGYNVMKSYYNQIEATKNAIDSNGWLHTGDIGFLREDGNVVLQGRKKDLIIRGGENISSKEIESVLSDEEQITECKAIGVPDTHYGEEVALCVVGSLTKEEIVSRYQEKVASYKIPRYILFFDVFPKTETGKIKVRELKENVLERIENHEKSST